MEWYYAVGGERIGPVDETAFRSLVENGTVGPSTLVWNAELPDWVRWGELSGAATPPPPLPAEPGTTEPTAICVECGQTFREQDGIRIDEQFICAGCKPTFFMRVQQGQPALKEFVYAGFWIRFVAKFVDGLIISVPFQILFGVLQYNLGGFSPESEFSAALGLVLVLSWIVPLAANLTYNAYFLSSGGATPGKRLVGIQVIRPNGEYVTFARGLGRTAGEMISALICYIGYIMVVFDARKRSLHDHMADTLVVYVSPTR